MKRIGWGLTGGAVVCALLLWMGVASLWAQKEQKGDQDISSLLERVRSTGSRKKDAEKDRERFTLSSPEEGKLKKQGSDREKSVRDKKRLTAEDYLEELRRGGDKGLTERYKTESTVRGLLEKMKEKDRETLGEKKEEGRRPEADITERRGPRNFRDLTPDYSLQKEYGLGRQGGMIGEGLVPKAGVTQRKAATAPTRELPDILKETAEYEKRLVKEYGERGVVPNPYVDPRLLDIQERQRFNRWLKQDHEVLLDAKGAKRSVGGLFDTYNYFGRLPQVNKSLKYRDAYVPYSQNFLSPALRGTVYSRNYISDTAKRNFNPNVSRSKFSNQEYWNLDVRESYQDWYVREFGVNNSYVPFSTSRQYEINTLKQWSDQMRRDYGVDIRPGQRTYADWYRIRTSKPK